MDHAQFKAIRKRFFPSDPTQFLIEMGFEGNRNTLKQKVRRFESGDLEIPKRVARFAWLLDQWRLQGSDLDALPSWPEDM